MRLKDQPTLQAEARRLLGRATADEALARTEDVRGTTTVIRRVWATEDMAGFHGWDHLRTVIRVESEVRIAYNIMALFRSVTQRSEERRRMPWRTLMRKATVALVAATEAQLAGLRPRRSAACI